MMKEFCMEMKRKLTALLVLAALVLGAPAVFAQTASYYVSTAGNVDNDGLSEETALNSLQAAYTKALEGDIRQVTVIGALDWASSVAESLGSMVAYGSVFNFSTSQSNPPEILITGKPGAAGAERAVISGAGTSGVVAILAGNARIRFEHIEISGGRKNAEGDEGYGIVLYDTARLSLGPGAVVRDNQNTAVFLMTGGASCILEGGEIRDNAGMGLVIGPNGSATMQSGAIRNNKSCGVAVMAGGIFTMNGGEISGNSMLDGAGGGVFVMGPGALGGVQYRAGSFTMNGGSITGNSASSVGGGVAVAQGGVFNQKGGSVTGNRANTSPNVYIASSGSGSGGSGSGSGSGSSGSGDSGFRYEFPASFGTYFGGFSPASFSVGLDLQAGLGLGFGDFGLSIMGEASAGVGFMSGVSIEYRLGGMAELYYDIFGLGIGYGTAGVIGLSGADADTPFLDGGFLRLALIFYTDMIYNKFTIYADKFADESWGIGLIMSMSF